MATITKLALAFALTVAALSAAATFAKSVDITIARSGDPSNWG